MTCTVLFKKLFDSTPDQRPESNEEEEQGGGYNILSWTLLQK